ncbi:MAG: hypothetical protein JWP25_1191 [Bradyrhizobium sp.]|jgi:hypothetical protein|nr:hypothetical protein [Bradyrhizobium sp.]
MERNVPYAVIVIIAAVGFAAILMFWAMEGTSGGRQAMETIRRQTGTTGSASRQSTETPEPAPTAPNDETASDSWRGPKGPVNRSH